MNKRIGYNIKILVDKLFPCHVLKTIVTEHEGEEFYKEKHSTYIAYPELTRVRFWHSTFTTTQTVYSDLGEEATAFSKNINSHDVDIPRINQMVQISPEIKMIDNTYCELSEELQDWIYKWAVIDRLITDETLQDILNAASKVFNVDYVLEFEGCPSPVHYEQIDSWAVCTTTNLTMLGTEIDTVLQNIKEESLLKKVEFIFKHYGKRRYE